MNKDFNQYYQAICGMMTFAFLIIAAIWLSSLSRRSSAWSGFAFLLACTYALFPLQGLGATIRYGVGMAGGSTESFFFFVALIQLIGFLVSFIMWFDLRQHGVHTSILPLMACPLPAAYLIFNL